LLPAWQRLGSLPVPVANPARKRCHPPMRNLSEIPKLNFENRF
jgi:hypothetical protein